MELFLNPLDFISRVCPVKSPLKVFVKGRHNLEGDGQINCWTHSDRPVRFVTVRHQLHYDHPWLAAIHHSIWQNSCQSQAAVKQRKQKQKQKTFSTNKRTSMPFFFFFSVKINRHDSIVHAILFNSSCSSSILNLLLPGLPRCCCINRSSLDQVLLGLIPPTSLPQEELVWFWNPLEF